MKRTSTKPPLLTFDCQSCETTWWGRYPGLRICPDCGGALWQRIEGAEPFEPGSYVENALPRAMGQQTADSTPPSVTQCWVATLPLFGGAGLK